MQTFDNLVDNVCNAKETYLSENVRDIMEMQQRIKNLKNFAFWINL